MVRSRCVARRCAGVSRCSCGGTRPGRRRTSCPGSCPCSGLGVPPVGAGVGVGAGGASASDSGADDASGVATSSSARDGRAVAATSAEASAPPSAPRRDVAADLEADLDSAPSTASLDAHAAATERRRLARRSAALSTDLHRAVARFDAGGWRTDGATAGRARPRPATIDISTATERRGNAGRCHGPGADGH